MFYRTNQILYHRQYTKGEVYWISVIGEPIKGEGLFSTDEDKYYTVKTELLLF